MQKNPEMRKYFSRVMQTPSITEPLNLPNGQDVRYAIDDSKLKALGWMPKANFDVELEKIVEYYRNNFVW
jgi:dTDP-glucose 4,6-dehydratase